MRAAVRRLVAAGIEAPGHEVQLLMLEASGLSRANLIAAATADAPADVRARFEAFIERRTLREPVQHILGWAGFYGLDLICDRRALIPRPDSECVVDAVLDQVRSDTPLQIADLGTGSGCLLLALLSHLPLATGTGVEADPGAASLARANIAACGLSERTRVHEGRWSDWEGWPSVDLIVSNPPYIPSGDIHGLEPEVRAFDPRMALDGGVDGLMAYREIVGLAGKSMKSGALLAFEVGHDQRAAVVTLLADAGFIGGGFRRDLGGHVRCVWGRMS